MSATTTVNAQPTTAGYLIGRALGKIGVGATGQTLQGDDLQGGLDELNEMLAQWQRRETLVWHLQDTACLSTGMSTYQIGQSAQLNTGYRVDKIDAAYARLLPAIGSEVGAIGGEFSETEFSNEFASSNTPVATLGYAGEFADADFNPEFNIAGGLATSSPNNLSLDYWLTVVESREDYAAISLKQLATFPSMVFLDAGYPFGTLFVWPVPQARRWEIHVLTKAPIAQFTSSTQTVLMPDEYRSAIVWNLAARLAPAYGGAPSQSIATFAKTSLDAIRRANGRVPQLMIDPALTHRRAGSDPWWAGLLGR